MTKCARCGGPATTRERGEVRARLAVQILASTGRISTVLEQDPKFCRDCTHDLQGVEGDSK